MSKFEDIFQSVTDRIIDGLENAEDWRKPWKSLFDGTVPHNASTGRAYNGVNFLNLSWASRKWGATGWVTYKQATALGGKVPSSKAENGGCEYVWFMSRNTYKDKETGEDKLGFINKCFPVWNVNQIEWEEGSKPYKEYTPPVSGTGAVNVLAESLDVDLHYGGDTACFIPSLDQVRMPSADAFKTAEDHDATLAHELIHWTGHSSRLNRKILNSKGGEAYAFEELVAELGAAFAGALLGIPYEGLQHEKYIAGWLKALKDDPRHIVKASAQASKAVTYLQENGSFEVLSEVA